MNNINLDTLSLTEKWALLAKLRDRRDNLDTDIHVLRDSITGDEAELAKKEAEAKLTEVVDETQGIPPIPSPLEENNG